MTRTKRLIAGAMLAAFLVTGPVAYAATPPIELPLPPDIGNPIEWLCTYLIAGNLKLPMCAPLP